MRLLAFEENLIQTDSMCTCVHTLACVCAPVCVCARACVSMRAFLCIYSTAFHHCQWKCAGYFPSLFVITSLLLVPRRIVGDIVSVGPRWVSQWKAPQQETLTRELRPLIYVQFTLHVLHGWRPCRVADQAHGGSEHYFSLHTLHSCLCLVLNSS